MAINHNTDSQPFLARCSEHAVFVKIFRILSRLVEGTLSLFTLYNYTFRSIYTELLRLTTDLDDLL